MTEIDKCEDCGNRLNGDICYEDGEVSVWCDHCAWIRVNKWKVL